MTGKPRVLIVEDHQALARNLAEFLEGADYALDFAQDGLTALHLLATQRYDVIVLDVMLPAISGFELCRRIREELHLTTPVILMTAKGHIDDKEAGFREGADDYLVKPFHLRELKLRIDALNRRGQSGASPVLAAGSVRFDPGTLAAWVKPESPLELSGRGTRIFELLMRRYPQFVSHEEMVQKIWDERETDINTIRTQMYALRKQLQAHLGAPLIKTVHGRGYRLDPPPAE